MYLQIYLKNNYRLLNAGLIYADYKKKRMLSNLEPAPLVNQR
ncbi:MAG: hypothetical protein AVDCRST_MAG96-1402 [uncultured Segetibacter sp.]|uniref:Uncharacterized protein n=1 Tax=uncultured Segetibacter sp. TaxID=481133 RepID=A0A6J4SDC5_9BACT|nr:MAG: hypothetical protein AVDCRST_MAG96-1402 [uncultured Segetibacter sp.]